MAALGQPESGHAVTTRLDPAVMRRAIRHFFWLRMRHVILLIPALAVASAILAFAFETNRDLRILTAALLVAVPLALSFVYWRYRRLAEGSFADFFGESIDWRFDDESMAWRGARLRGEAAWSVLSRLHLFPDYWLLHYRNNSFNVVPAQGIADAVRDFVAATAARHGARVSRRG